MTEALLTPDSPGWNATAQAVDLYVKGREQLDRVIMGEQVGKEAVLLSLLTGQRLVFAGPPSAGKTDLTSAGHQLVEDIDPLLVAAIAPMDQAPQELTGGKVSIEKLVKDKDGERTEEMITTLKGLIKPETQGIILHEFNRYPSEVLVPLLEIIESSTFYTSEGAPITLEDLDYVAADMNPVNNREGTFGIPSAWRSRFTIGSVLGVDPETNNAIFADAAKGSANNFPTTKKAKPADLLPVVNRATLRALRKEAEVGIKIAPALQPLVAEALKKAHFGLHEAVDDFREAPARFAYRTVKSAQGLALLRGNKDGMLDEKDLRDAICYTLVARIGMSGYLEDEPQVVANNIVDSL